MKSTFIRPILALGGLAATALIWHINKPAEANANAISTQGKPAPELVGNGWLNTDKPITLASRRGKVTVVEFWTFECSNCRANLPAYAKWARQFKARGVEVIGVHTPELEAERNPKNVAAEVKKLGIKYPVLLDAGYENWNRWHQQFWPTIYLVDKNGQIRDHWEGELDYGGAGGTQKMTEKIENLLNEKTDNATQSDPVTKTDAEWRAELSPDAYNVLRQHGTERAFSGALWDNHEKGIYDCAGCGQQLFSSDTKFESGTGWPSFFKSIKPGAITEIVDSSYGMRRTEVVCSNCGGHLGHVFNDGPRPTGMRYCMNSAALKFEKDSG